MFFLLWFSSYDYRLTILNSLKVCYWSGHIVGASTSSIIGPWQKKHCPCHPLLRLLLLAVGMIPNMWHSSYHCIQHSWLMKLGVICLTSSYTHTWPSWLAVQASSTALERLSSQAGFVVTAKRNRMSGEMATLSPREHQVQAVILSCNKGVGGVLCASIVFCLPAGGVRFRLFLEPN